MAQIKVLYDNIGGTLSVWWGNPQDEEVCEETEHEIILIKDKRGEVIGLEKLHFAGETRRILPSRQRPPLTCSP